MTITFSSILTVSAFICAFLYYLDLIYLLDYLDFNLLSFCFLDFNLLSFIFSVPLFPFSIDGLIELSSHFYFYSCFNNYTAFYFLVFFSSGYTVYMHRLHITVYLQIIICYFMSHLRPYNTILQYPPITYAFASRSLFLHSNQYYDILLQLSLGQLFFKLKKKKEKDLLYFL